MYGKEEAESIARMILEKVTGYSRLQMHLHQTEPLPDSKIMEIEEIMRRLSMHEPIQYVLGETYFMGFRMIVSPAVLIPRQETEELVQWIVEEEKSSCQRLLDMGTGSGCIPIAVDLLSAIPWVEGWDISEEALSIARKNGEINGSAARFARQDILQTKNVDPEVKWDVIVSNPPYVLQEESLEMERHVLDFEPHLALFVPNEDPLLFYRAIVAFAGRHLSPDGRLYCEINESKAVQVAQLFREAGFKEIQTRLDLQGKHRMIRGSGLSPR
ncbi:MAG: peptide chain release factor N(5)-glutamine methyltransferase [Marinilabiliales bacterium]|nr:peptide chain release factor N(5)-glutamine methyltransferase [Marinilabiliales bacterium]